MTEIGSALYDLAELTLDDAEDLLIASNLASSIDSTAQGIESLVELAALIGLSGDLDLLDNYIGEIKMHDMVAGVAIVVIRCFSVLRVDYQSRNDAAIARDGLRRLSEKLIEMLDDQYPDTFSFIVDMVGASVRELSSLAANLAPLINVEVGLRLPSSVLAFDLYGDPERGLELIERNVHGEAMLMPKSFEAVAK